MYTYSKISGEARDNFAKRLKRIMEQKGVRQVDLATYLNTPKALVSHYLSGERMPSIPRVEQIADYLGVPTSELLGFSNNMIKIPIYDHYPFSSSNRVDYLERAESCYSKYDSLFALLIKEDYLALNIKKDDIVLFCNDNNFCSNEGLVLFQNGDLSENTNAQDNSDTIVAYAIELIRLY